MTQAAGFKWIKWARVRHLQGPAQGVLNVIASHSNAAGESWPSVETIAVEAGISKSTVKKAIRTLVEAGIMNLDQSNGRRPNTYRMGGAQLPLFATPPIKKSRRKARPAKRKAPAIKPAPIGTPASRFYDAANGGQQVAAIVDYLTAAGIQVDDERKRKRIAGFVKKHKTDRKGRVWSAVVTAAQSKPEGDVMNLAERVYQHGQTRETERRDSSRRARRTDDRATAEADW